VTDKPLIELRDALTDDPVRPTSHNPTPVEVVADLTFAERMERLGHLMDSAQKVVDEALAVHLDDKRLAATCTLYSGGSDSTVLLHLMRDRSDYAIHANTGIGVEQTREFVRDTCRLYGVDLIEKHAPDSYRDLVLKNGFPGPPMHARMYQRLKERPLMQAKRQLVKDGRTERVLFLAGRRRAESARRRQVPAHERRGAIIWASPLVNWTVLDLSMYKREFEVPSSDASQHMHMSGECLCGAFAKPGELDEIAFWFPQVAASIRALESEAVASGIPEPFCRWGHGQGKPKAAGPMCDSCELRFDEDPSE
jgi:3'-phosphoadenosine 5'-phosphosulfate sulfotransferase (PAPS reductase)/FAD synthetase